MRSPLYIRQLKRDLDHWVKEGLLAPAEAEALLETAGMGGSERSLPSILALLGTLMLGLAAISYVAANFWAIPRISLLALLIGTMWAVYAGGCYLLLRTQEGLGQAAVLLGAILFGTNIMLIAQMYHISAHYPDGVMTWAIGALLVAALVPSRGALGLAYILGLIWTSMETFDFDVMFHTPYLAFWAVAFVLSHLLTWRAGFHIGFLSLVYWLGINAADLADLYGWSEFDVTAIFAIFWLAVWAAGCFLSALYYPYGQALARYGILLFLITFYVAHVFFDDIDGGLDAQTPVLALTALTMVFVLMNGWRSAYSLLDIFAHVGMLVAILLMPTLIGTDGVLGEWVYNAIFIGITIWLLSLGARYNETFLINCALTAFGAEMIYIYFRTFDTLLNQSMFFAVGGILLVGLALALETVRRKISQDDTDQDHGDTPAYEPIETDDQGDAS